MAVVALSWFLWNRYVSPTRIAVINYTDSQYSQLLDVNDNGFIGIERMEEAGVVEKDLSRYAVTLIFGMGLRFDEAQLEAIRKAAAKGARIYLTASTSRENELTNLSREDLEQLGDYVSNGGRKNTRRLLNYVRRVMDGKTLFTDPVEKADIVPMDALYHLAGDVFFEKVADYDAYRREQGLHKEGRPRVALLSLMAGPRRLNGPLINALIEKLESRNLNVYPIAGYVNRLNYLKEIAPDIVVHLPHGRLTMTGAEDTIAWLKEQNIPLLCPLSVNQPYEKWVASQEGLVGGMLSQSIVVPELDGGIEPFAVGAQYPDERGLFIAGGIHERLDTFASRVEKWLALKAKPNSEKRLAIVYYKGPGRNAMVAAGLEVAPSLLNLLRHLQSEGYQTGPLPESDEVFMEMIQNKGPVLGPYAKGTFDQFLREGDPELIPVEEYLSWVREQLDPGLYAQVEEQYGAAPGEYLSVSRDGVAYLVLPRVQFGNVVILPQLMPALGEDTNQLVHGVKQAPPHPYLTTYLWARHGFNADALMHFGTHGSFEFTPWKQSALSQFDWADALIGDLPHPYLYVINNIGEAVIAKRRSYATIVSHLTPPFIESELYGPLMALDRAVNGYLHSTDQALQVEFAKDIRKGILEMELHKDLEIEGFGEYSEVTPEIADKLHDYLHTIAQEKITEGLYTVAVPYSAKQSRETARLMAIDPIAYSLAHLAEAKGRIKPANGEQLRAFSDSFRSEANSMIGRILDGQATVDDFVEQADLARLDAWDQEHQKKAPAGMIGGGRGKPQGDAEVDTGRLRELFLEITEDDEQFKFVRDLRNESRFESTAGVLDMKNADNRRKLELVVPGLRENAGERKTPQVIEFLQMMHGSAGARDEARRLLDSPEVVAELREAQQRARQERVDIALGDAHKTALFATADPAGFEKVVEDWDAEKLEAFLKRMEFYAANVDLAGDVEQRGGKDAAAVAAILRLGRGNLELAVKAARNRLAVIEEEESEYVEAVRTFRDTLQDVCDYEKALADSPQAELAGAIRALNGGYIEPSTGGDPIINPNSVPTGRNLAAIDMVKTPSPQSWKVGVQLADSIIRKKLDETGQYPKKVAVTLWGGMMIRSEATEVATIFHLLGVEPVRDSRGSVNAVRLVPMEELKRPRIDVIVQTSGQARDIAASRLFLINEAVKLAAEADDPPDTINHVREGALAAEQVMKDRGLSPLDARAFSTARVFGGVNGNYGAAIMGLVESGDRWESDEEISDRYLNNMGALYTKEHWGRFVPGVFEAALQNTDTIAHTRNSNTWGPLSLDHVYEFMGGLNATIRNVTGNDPDAYFTDLRNRHNPVVQGAKEAIWTETRTTLLNPKYIEALQQGGATSAETFAETFRNTYGWDVMKPDVIDEELWEGLYDVYVEDKYQMNMEAYFRDKNPYALQEMTAVMLETIRKGYWDATAETIERLAELHAELVRDHDAGCSGFVCDNSKLRDMIAQRLAPELAQRYNSAIDQARIGGAQEPVEGMRLEKQITMDEVKRMVANNMTTLLALAGLVIAFAAAVIIGARRRRN